MKVNMKKLINDITNALQDSNALDKSHSEEVCKTLVYPEEGVIEVRAKGTGTLLLKVKITDYQ